MLALAGGAEEGAMAWAGAKVEPPPLRGLIAIPFPPEEKVPPNIKGDTALPLPLPLTTKFSDGERALAVSAVASGGDAKGCVAAGGAGSPKREEPEVTCWKTGGGGVEERSLPCDGADRPSADAEAVGGGGGEDAMA